MSDRREHHFTLDTLTGSIAEANSRLSALR